MNRIINKVIRIITSFDKNKKNPDLTKIKSIITKSVRSNKPIKMVCFTCSTINDRYLFDEERPWNYVCLNPKENNLETDIPVLKSLVKKLSSIYPVKLTIIIGNTDPFYIYTQSFSILKQYKQEYLWEKYSARWEKYRIKLSKWLKSQGLTNFEVISWYEFEKRIETEYQLIFKSLFKILLPNIKLFITKKDFSRERKVLRSAFGEDKYFKYLKPPKAKVLKIWIRRKFTEYMLQGFFIYKFIPNSILIQNEKPSILRCRMYQPLINILYKDRLPNIYPFGVYKSGYQ